MAGFKDNALERRNASLAAKKTLLEKFKAQPAPDDPAVLQRTAERQAIAAAREIRAAERKVAREADLARQALEEIARKAEEAARDLELLRQKADQAVRDEEIKAERKALRDAKYAARKARGRR